MSSEEKRNRIILNALSPDCLMTLNKVLFFAIGIEETVLLTILLSHNKKIEEQIETSAESEWFLFTLDQLYLPLNIYRQWEILQKFKDIKIVDIKIDDWNEEEGVARHILLKFDHSRILELLNRELEIDAELKGGGLFG